MSRPPRPPQLPMRQGVSASCAVVRPGDGPTVLDFLAARLPALARAAWAERLAAGEVLDAAAQPLAARAACQPGQRLYYYRRQDAEPPPHEDAVVLYRDDWLVVADKPHFMPVTPSGRFVQRSLLVQLKQRLGLPDLSPIHRIDRETAGLVLLSVQPQTRGAYQALLRDARLGKLYEAVAPRQPALAAPRRHISRLERDPARFFLSCEVAGGPNSETHIECAALLDVRHALYRLRPVTGQRHQLRLHMQALGAPILGDGFYPQVLRGPGAPDDLARPLQLLAREVVFDDPVTGQPRRFTSARTLAAAAGRWPAEPPADQASAPRSVSAAGVSGV